MAFLAGAAGCGLLCAFLIVRLLRRKEKTMEAAIGEARRLTEEEGARERLRLEQEKRGAELDLMGKEQMLRQEEGAVREQEAELKAGMKSLEEERAELEKIRAEAEANARRYGEKLRAMQNWTEEEARLAALEEAKRNCEGEIQDMRTELLGKTEEELEEQGKQVLLSVMQRIASQPTNETSATLVKLKSEDMKGRIIGREGRNIRSFEAVTGTTLLIDETPDSVLVSSFEPVRREVARMALEALMKDGRINPSTIEDAVSQSERDVQKTILEWGEKALRQLRLKGVSEEVLELVGKMHYRLSNNQNTLDHSIEVASISSLLAAEVGLDQTLAKRAGLFHDMGKSLGQEFDGSHAMMAAEVLRKYGEDERVVNAVAAHHEEMPDESLYAPLLKVADSLSAMRPGARTDSMESYIRRVKNLEAAASSIEGVEEAYAIQAGREIRVIVSPSKVDDEGARRLALTLRQKVEEELNFPGTIKITVIREQRFHETAK